MIAPQGFLRSVHQLGGRNVTLVTHHNRHLDEMAAIRVLKKYATPSWVAEHCPDDELYLGCGGREFDDHRPEIVAAKKDCCATLVMRSLGVKDDKEWRVMQYVLQDDRNGPANSPLVLSKVANRMNRYYLDTRASRRSRERLGWNHETVTDWVSQALDAKYRQHPYTRNFEITEIHDVMEYLEGFDATAWYKQAMDVQNYERALFMAAEEIFKESAKVEAIEGTDLHLAVCETDNWQFASVVRRLGIGVIVQREPGLGNVQVFTNSMLRVTLVDVVHLLRIAEQKARGLVDRAGLPLVIDAQVLRANGSGWEGSPWYYHRDMEAMMNGSTTAWAPPTVLPLPLIEELVKQGIKMAVNAGRRAAPKQKIKVQR